MLLRYSEEETNITMNNLNEIPELSRQSPEFGQNKGVVNEFLNTLCIFNSINRMSPSSCLTQFLCPP